MVEFQVPQPFPAELEEMVNDQRIVVHDLFVEGKLLSYTLAHNRSKIWGIFFADSESELISLLDRLPMTPYMQFDYTELMFHETVQFIPAMSLN